MLNFLNIFGNHEIDAWRDDYTLLAAATLNQVAADLIAGFEGELKAATWKDGLVGQQGFIANRVTPKVRQAAEPVVARLIDEANGALARIVEHQAVWSEQPMAANDAAGGFEAWQDVAVAAGPLAGGVAVAAALPAMAVVHTSAWFGLVTATTISWPVVLGGGAVAGIAIATGVLNTGRIWDKTEARLRRKVRDHVVATLIQGDKKHSSILEQLTAALAAAAEQARKL